MSARGALRNGAQSHGTHGKQGKQGGNSRNGNRDGMKGVSLDPQKADSCLGALFGLFLVTVLPALFTTAVIALVMWLGGEL